MTSKEPEKSLYDAIKDAGIPFSNHESDLYFKKTDKSTAILRTYALARAVATTFVNQAPPNVGEIWYDVPFAYMPFWEKVSRVCDAHAKAAAGNSHA